jgi:pimeloyl-ACP methyl ester carboxylesterase
MLLEGHHSADGTAPVVLGHEIGGSIALDLASRQPNSMRGLILHAPVGADLDTRLFPKIMSTRPVREIIRRLISAKLPRPLFRRLFSRSGHRRAIPTCSSGTAGRYQGSPHRANFFMSCTVVP